MSIASCVALVKQRCHRSVTAQHHTAMGIMSTTATASVTWLAVRVRRRGRERSRYPLGIKYVIRRTEASVFGPASPRVQLVGGLTVTSSPSSFMTRGAPMARLRQHLRGAESLVQLDELQLRWLTDQCTTGLFGVRHRPRDDREGPVGVDRDRSTRG